MLILNNFSSSASLVNRLVKKSCIEVDSGLITEWQKQYEALNEQEFIETKKIIANNDFRNIDQLSNNHKIRFLLFHYTFKRDDIKEARQDTEYKTLKNKFDKFVREDQFIDLTLTYDFNDVEALQVYEPLIPDDKKKVTLAIAI